MQRSAKDLIESLQEIATLRRFKARSMPKQRLVPSKSS